MQSPKIDHDKPVSRGSSRRAQQQRRRKVRFWTRVGLALAVLGVAAAIGGVLLSGPDAEKAEVDRTNIQLQLGDYFIAGDLEVPAGKVRIEAANIGVLLHNVGVRRGPITTNLRTGETAKLDVELLPGTYELYCDVDDHVARGMVATLRVIEAVPEAVPVPTG